MRYSQPSRPESRLRASRDNSGSPSPTCEKCWRQNLEDLENANNVSCILSDHRERVYGHSGERHYRERNGLFRKVWNILGQIYYPKATCDSAFAFEANTEPGQFVPVHVHPTQDEFILMQEGILDLKLDGVWVQAKVGDLVRLLRGIPHGYFNKSNKPARAFFWVSPTRKLEALFDKLHGLTDPAEVVAISSQHEVDFMPPEAND